MKVSLRTELGTLIASLVDSGHQFQEFRDFLDRSSSKQDGPRTQR